MKRIIQTFLAAALATAAGCTSSPPTTGTSTSSLAAPVQRSSVPLTRAERSADAVGQGAARLAGILYGEAAPERAFQDAVARSEPVQGSRHLGVDWKPGLRVSYRAANDDLLVINEEVTRDTGSRDDVGAAAAEGLFRGAFRQAIAQGAVEALGLDAANARRSFIVQGEGVSGEAPVERVKEYIFTVPRTSNGVEIFDAGLEVSVHRNGRLARLRSFGPHVDPAAPAQGGALAQVVTQEQADARAHAEFPKAEIKPLGLRYWLPESGAQEQVAPREMYFVSPTADVGGDVVHARGFFVAYSVQDAAETATVWPRAAPDARGDARP